MSWGVKGGGTMGVGRLKDLKIKLKNKEDLKIKLKNKKGLSYLYKKYYINKLLTVVEWLLYIS